MILWDIDIEIYCYCDIKRCVCEILRNIDQRKDAKLRVEGFACKWAMGLGESEQQHWKHIKVLLLKEM